MQLHINEQVYTVADQPFRFLLPVLRDELGLTGAKYGCGGGFCGACTVIVDGQAMRSCITPLSEVADKAIRTVEGLAEINAEGQIVALHPIQQAFITHQVPQCGWCMGGQMMTAVAFLEANPAPDEAAIVAAMGDNYCRCGCYVRIKSAVAAASALMRGAA